MTTTHPTPKGSTMSTFTVTTSASTASEAMEQVAKRLTEGFALTGKMATVRSERHRLWTVECANLGGDRDACWVNLTSYGHSPSDVLGSRWEAAMGASAQ